MAILSHTEAYRRELLRLTNAMASFQPAKAPWKAIALHQWLKDFFVPLIEHSERIKADIVIAHYDDLGYRIAGYDTQPQRFLADSFQHVLRVSQRLHDLAIADDVTTMPLEETNQLTDQLQREVRSIYHDLSFHYDEEERVLVYILAKEGVDLWHQALLGDEKQSRKATYAQQYHRKHRRKYGGGGGGSDKAKKAAAEDSAAEHRNLRLACVMHAAGYKPPAAKAESRASLLSVQRQFLLSQQQQKPPAEAAPTDGVVEDFHTPHGSPKASPGKATSSAPGSPKHHASPGLHPPAYFCQSPTHQAPLLETPWCGADVLPGLLQLVPWFTRSFRLPTYAARYEHYRDLIVSLYELDQALAARGAQQQTVYGQPAARRYNGNMKALLLRRQSSFLPTTASAAASASAGATPAAAPWACFACTRPGASDVVLDAHGDAVRRSDRSSGKSSDRVIKRDTSRTMPKTVSSISLSLSSYSSHSHGSPSPKQPRLPQPSPQSPQSPQSPNSSSYSIGGHNASFFFSKATSSPPRIAPSDADDAADDDVASTMPLGSASGSHQNLPQLARSSSSSKRTAPSPLSPAAALSFSQKSSLEAMVVIAE
jgi:hypothetical protein